MAERNARIVHIFYVFFREAECESDPERKRNLNPRSVDQMPKTEKGGRQDDADPFARAEEGDQRFLVIDAKDELLDGADDQEEIKQIKKQLPQNERLVRADQRTTAKRGNPCNAKGEDEAYACADQKLLIVFPFEIHG